MQVLAVSLYVLVDKPVYYTGEFSEVLLSKQHLHSLNKHHKRLLCTAVSPIISLCEDLHTYTKW